MVKQGHSLIGQLWKQNYKENKKRKEIMSEETQKENPSDGEWRSFPYLQPRTDENRDSSRRS